MQVYSRSQGKVIEQPDQVGGAGELGGGGNIEQILAMKALSGELKHTEATGLINLLRSAGMIPGEPSAATEKSEMTIGNLERKISLAESLWFPHEDKMALKAKDPNLLTRTLGKYQTKFKSSSEYELFRRYVGTLGATLAKAAGDTGNIAWAEQAAQLQALADADLTPEEAQISFVNIRKGLDLAGKDNTYYNDLRTKPSNLDKLRTAKEAQGIIETGTEGKPGVDKILRTEDRPRTSEQLASAKPYVKAGGQIGASLLPFPMNLVAAGGVGAGTEAVPEFLRRQEEQVRGNVPQYGQQQAENVDVMGKVFGTGLKQAGLQAALTPLKTLGGVRTGLAQQAIKTEPVAEAAVGAKLTPGLIKSGQQTLLDLISRYGGQSEKGSKLFQQMTDLERKSRTLTGTVKASGASEAQQVGAQGIRTLLQQQAPAASKISSLMQPFVVAKGQIGGLISKLAPWAIFAALMKKTQGGSGGAGN